MNPGRYRQGFGVLGLVVALGVLGGCADDAAVSPSGGAATSGATPAQGKASEPVGGGDAPHAKATDRPDPEVNDDGAPGKPDKAGAQGAVFERVPGKASSACVTVGTLRDVRSGGFVAGPFDDARASYGKKRAGFTAMQVQLYFVPEHSVPMPGLTVVATSQGSTVRLKQKVVADAEQWKFYSTKIALSHAGTWTFRVISGRDRGCFVASF